MARMTKEEKLSIQLEDKRHEIFNLESRVLDLELALDTARKLNEELRRHRYEQDAAAKKQEEEMRELAGEVSCLRTESEQYRRVANRLHDHREALLDAFTEAKGNRSDP